MNPQLQQEMYYPILLAVGLALYVAWRLRESRYGRAWMAIREDEEVAEAMGINLVGTKLLAFATGAAMAGLGGALFASKVQTIFPASFNLLISINVLVLIIVGGMGSVPGVFIGALVLVALPELLREFSDFRLLIYGMVLVMMMLKRPEGLWPTAIARREMRVEGRSGR
jgi:branched-chain amino acid transport system permease protein